MSFLCSGDGLNDDVCLHFSNGSPQSASLGTFRQFEMLKVYRFVSCLSNEQIVAVIIKETDLVFW